MKIIKITNCLTYTKSPYKEFLFNNMMYATVGSLGSQDNIIKIFGAGHGTIQHQSKNGQKILNLIKQYQS